MNQGLVKIAFVLDPADWHRSASETLWAKPLGSSQEPKAFELQNTPFHAKGVSYLDVVRATEQDGQYVFAGTITPSGHSTYRLLAACLSPEFEGFHKSLQDLGCTYESGVFGLRKIFAIDVPPTTDIYAVYRILENGEKANVWTFEEGHVGHRIAAG